MKQSSRSDRPSFNHFSSWSGTISWQRWMTGWSCAMASVSRDVHHLHMWPKKTCMSRRAECYHPMSDEDLTMYAVDRGITMKDWKLRNVDMRSWLVLVCISRTEKCCLKRTTTCRYTCSLWKITCNTIARGWNHCVRKRTRMLAWFRYQFSRQTLKNVFVNGSQYRAVSGVTCAQMLTRGTELW